MLITYQEYQVRLKAITFLATAALHKAVNSWAHSSQLTNTVVLKHLTCYSKNWLWSIIKPVIKLQVTPKNWFLAIIDTICTSQLYSPQCLCFIKVIRHVDKQTEKNLTALSRPMHKGNNCNAGALCIIKFASHNYC